MKKIIIDTDPGVDDALAIMLAYGSEKLDVMALTTVCGNTTIENATRNAEFIADVIGVSTPIYAGSSAPLIRKLTQATVHGVDGLAGVKVNKVVSVADEAVARMADIISMYPNEITLVALGPLTNIARLFRDYPDTTTRIKEVVIMGGAIEVPGNMNRVAEFNIYVDPEAADIVMRTPVKKTLVPLDICNRALLYTNELNVVRPGLIKDVLMKIVGMYSENIGTDTGIDAAILYDPLAVYCALENAKYSTTLMDIAVETEGVTARGMTVADRRASKKPEKSDVAVVVEVDLDDFKSTFIKSLNRIGK